ncbi:MAG: DUF2474 domain-containing protein [Alcaligenaceae bacterium]|nr:DUF2474 domain-containing protein [Alcaligenaceae bacterium]
MTGARVTRWTRRVAWLLALWAAGVAVLGIAAWVLKAVMRAVGLAA